MTTATPLHGSISRVYANARDLTPFVRNIATKESFDIAESTGFGAAADAHVPAPFAKGQITADGMFVSSAATATPVLTGGTVHDALKDAIGNANSYIAHVIQDILGGQAGTLYGTITDYGVDNATRAVVAANLDSHGNVGIEWNEVLHPVLATTETAAGNSSYVDDGASALLTSGAVAYLMVFSLTGTSITVKLQSCTTSGGAYVDVTGGAFAAVSAATALASGAAACQRLVIPTSSTINRYVRCAWTGTFNPCVFLMLFARN